MSSERYLYIVAEDDQKAIDEVHQYIEDELGRKFIWAGAVAEFCLNLERPLLLWKVTVVFS